MISALHPTTDIAKILRHVRFVPEAGIRLILSEMPDAQDAVRLQRSPISDSVRDSEDTS